MQPVKLPDLWKRELSCFLQDSMA